MKRFALGCLVAATLGAAGVAPARAADTALPYLIVEDSWIYMIDAPRLYLDRAHEDLRHGHPALAAAAVRKAAALVGDEASRAGGPDQGRLQRDAGALLQVADEVDTGRIAGPRRLDLAVVTARADLGVHHDLGASEAWARKDAQEAGRSLAAASRYVEGALVTLDDKVAASSAQGLQTIEGFGEHLAAGTDGAVQPEWARARATMDQALNELFRKLGMPHVG
jgi:hypothetical protein